MLAYPLQYASFENGREEIRFESSALVSLRAISDGASLAPAFESTLVPALSSENSKSLTIWNKSLHLG